MILSKDPFGIVPIIEPVIVGMGYDFWGLECQSGANNAQVRVYIDSSEGVTLDDCARVSQQLSALLDVEDPIKVPYTLEISSPGINRPLFSEEQMKRAVGDKVKVKTLWPVEERRNFSGILKSVEKDRIKIDAGSNETYLLSLDAIKNVKLDLDIEFNN